MFYSNNDSYMQDLYFYNQIPNTYGMPNNMANNMQMNMQNPNMMQMYNTNLYGSNNYTNLYPSIYRIILPVVSKVVSNSNYQYLNEDNLNNMVDTVFNIVDGQIEYNDEISTNTSVTQSSTNTGTTNSNINRNAETRTTNTQTNNRNDALLKDLIKILILKEIMCRNLINNQSRNNNWNYSQCCNIQPYNMNF